MRYILPLFFAFLLASCTLPHTESAEKIQSLEQEVAMLKSENTKLAEENEALQKSGNIPDFSQAKSTDFGLPEGMTFEETSNTECLQKAVDHFIEAGNTQCRQAGHSEADIKSKKCKLSQELINVLLAKKNAEELQCGTMQ